MIKVLAGLVSSEISLLGLQRAAFPLCPHVVFVLFMFIPDASWMSRSSLLIRTGQIQSEPFLKPCFN